MTERTTAEALAQAKYDALCHMVGVKSRPLESTMPHVLAAYHGQAREELIALEKLGYTIVPMDDGK
jgi:iron-sulfur cluster repair protein YtfE (RIC family)